MTEQEQELSTGTEGLSYMINKANIYDDLYMDMLVGYMRLYRGICFPPSTVSHIGDVFKEDLISIAPEKDEIYALVATHLKDYEDYL